MPVTISQLADHILGREATNGEDFAQAKLPMMGGCERCSASIACYNAYPSKTGNLRCEDCIGDLGYETVEEAKAAIFPAAERNELAEALIALCREYKRRVPSIMATDGTYAPVFEAERVLRKAGFQP